MLFRLRSNCFCSDLLPCLPFLYLASQLGPEYESQLSSTGPFPSSLAKIWTVSGSAAPPTPTFSPCWLWGSCLHPKRKPADWRPHPPTNTEPPVSPACAVIGKTPVNGCTVGPLYPHQQRTVYLQVEWWNTGNTLQRNQANLPRRASSSQSGSWCPRIGPSCFGIGQRMDSSFWEKWFEPRLPQLTIHSEGKPTVCHALHTCPDRWSGASGGERPEKADRIHVSHLHASNEFFFFHS